MPIEKPKKPTELVPRAFGGIKNNFSDDLQSTGFEPNIPQTYNGDNINYHLDATGKELDYVEKVVDYINQMPVDSSLYVNSNNELDYINVGQFGNKADKDLANTGRITNCIIEIPQRVKVELNNETLTLKAGSEIIIPNGFEVDGTTPKFDYITIANDLSYPSSGTAGVTYEFFLFYNITDKALHVRICTSCISGTTAPNYTTYLGWYDTNENKIKNSNNSGSTWDTYLSLPVAQMSCVNGTWTKISQIFNGMGYIGSTIWVDKGVKYLVPNGRNEDGSLNNIEIIKPKILIKNVASNANGLYKYVLGSDNNIYFGSGWYYDNKENYNRTADGKISLVLAQNAELVCNTGKITSFEIKQPFRAVDYNDLDTKVNKAGDTMTGPLTTMMANNATIATKTTSIAYNEAPSANAGFGQFSVLDKNGDWMAVYGAEKYTDGRNLAKMQVRASDGSHARMQIWADKNNQFYCDFPKCTTKATTTSTASNYKVAVVTQNYVNGTSWYRVWSDGWIEQGGSVTVVATVTFLKPFSNANYAIVGTLTSGSTSHWEPVIIDNRTAKSCQINSSYSRTVSWYACGY